MHVSSAVVSIRLARAIWLLALLGSIALSLLVSFKPSIIIVLLNLHSAKTTETALHLLHLLQLPVWLFPLGCLGAVLYFTAAARRARIAPPASPRIPSPAHHLSAHFRWNITLLILAASSLVIWLIPINDGLQDDEADKLRVALWDWDYWTQNAFNIRVNILPITFVRLVYTVTQNRVEWQLRLPLLLLFGLPLLYMFAVSLRQRFSPFTSALLLIFFGLSGIMGEYSAKVQGYLAALTFSTATFILWIDLIREREPEKALWRGGALAICSLCAYFSHNFTLFFLLGLFATTLLVEFFNHRRGVIALGAVTIISFMSILFLAVAVTIPLSISTIITHVGFSIEKPDPSLSAFYNALASAMTGSSHTLSPVPFLCFFGALLVLLRFEPRPYRAEITLAALLLLGLFFYYWIFNPRFFIDRFMIWLPLVWLPILAEGVRVFLERRWPRSPRRQSAAYLLVGGLFLLTMLPSQISWQRQRTTAIHLGIAAQTASDLAGTYQAQGYSVGYLLLRSYGNYAHRMWFYFPQDRTVSDHNSDATLDELRRAIPSQVWIVPVPRNQLSDDYSGLMERAVEHHEAGQVTVYAVFDEALDASHPTTTPDQTEF